jgi:hypothetical protein
VFEGKVKKILAGAVNCEVALELPGGMEITSVSHRLIYIFWQAWMPQDWRDLALQLSRATVSACSLVAPLPDPMAPPLSVAVQNQLWFSSWGVVAARARVASRSENIKAS